MAESAGHLSRTVARDHTASQAVSPRRTSQAHHGPAAPGILPFVPVPGRLRATEPGAGEIEGE